MLIQLLTHVPKRTKTDFVLNTPKDSPEEATWVWMEKGFRSYDIVEIMKLSDKQTVVLVWSEVEQEYVTLLVGEPFETVFDKWESAEARQLIFQEGEFHEGEEDEE